MVQARGSAARHLAGVFPATPYTLHPTPCTLHPTPHTLHPTPHTLNPTPYTLHPTPYTPHPTPHTLHLTPYTLSCLQGEVSLDVTGVPPGKYDLVLESEGILEATTPVEVPTPDHSSTIGTLVKGLPQG